MSGASDGEEGHSYLDVAEFLVREGARPDEDLAELWGRIVFSRLVGNSDDHLRNHGFILERGGWRLSPMFDVNPNPDAAFAALDLTPGVQGASSRVTRLLPTLGLRISSSCLRGASAADLV
jgi:hypothetical protein